MDNTEISLSFKNNVTGENKLKEYEKRLQNIYSLLSGLDSGYVKTLNDATKQTKNLDSEAIKTKNSVEKLGKQFNIAFNTASLVAFTNATKRFFSSMMKMVSESSSYIENVNLLEVAYHNANETIEESSKRIEGFIGKMSEVYGFDESRLTRSFGIFKQMANAMKLPSETAEQLSEHLVKMSNDIASLYNLDLSRAENALQSALAGQIRPIRIATGADIAEKTLQNTVDALGLDRTINQLSYVEKRLVMIISLTQQLKNSQGDYGRTIESVSNQIRVMKEQWLRLSRAVGNVFYPILEKILPYLNAVLMVLTEIFNFLAKMLGFKMPEFDYSGLSGTSDAVLDLEDSLDGAGKSADKLKNKLNGLRKFDNLNVISSPSDSGSGGTAGAGGGIDPTIMDAFDKVFSSYDDKLDSIKMKATTIRDRIMEWLGFTKHVNQETGEVSFTLDDTNSTLYKLLKALKDIWKYGKKVIVDVFKIIKDDFDNGIFGNALVWVFERIRDLFKWISEHPEVEEFLAKILETIISIKIAIGLIKGLGIITGISNVTKALGGLIGSRGGLTGGAFGLLGTLGLLTILTETVWIISITSYGIKEATKALQETQDAIYNVTNDTNSLTRELIDLSKAGDTTSDRFKKLAGYLERNAERQVELAKNVNTTKEDHDRLMQSAEQTLKIFYELGNETPELRDEYDKLAQKLGVSKKAFKDTGEQMNSFSGDVEKAKNKSKDFSATINNTNKTTLPTLSTKLMNSDEKLKKLSNSIVTSKVGKLDNDLSNAGKSAETSKNKIKEMQEQIDRTTGKKITLDIDANIAKAKNKLTELFRGFGGGILSGGGFRKNGGILVNGKWQPVSMYGGGGLPPVGQMFVARENGPELVGQISGHTAVMNNDQIVSSVSNGVYRAVKDASGGGQPMNATFVIQVGSKEVARQVITDLQGMAKSNGKPITIGG